MAKLLEMPKLSPTMEEGVLTLWHKKEGDVVGVDDLLAEVETDKATMEYRSFDAGTLLKLLVPAGATVLLGQPVGIIGQPGDDISALLAASPKATGAAPVQSAAVTAAPVAPAQTVQTAHVAREPAAVATPTSANGEPVVRQSGSILTRTERAGSVQHAQTLAVAQGRALASPHVRRLALEQGVELTHVRGTGPHGRVLPEDLQAAPQGARSVRAAGTARADEKKPLSMMRKTIARRLTESKQTVPHFYLTADLDAAALVRLREDVNADFARQSPSTGGPAAVKLSVNDYLIKAAAIALRRVPECNASFTPEALVFHGRVDISVAVSVPDGLVTPVVRGADALSVVDISAAVRELASRAKAKKLAPEEMQGGTFSVSNLGMFGIDSFSAVINPPEGAILTVGQVRDVPVVEHGAVVPGKRLSVTLSCDHRVIDGAVGAKFLAEFRALVEHPGALLLA